jgi:hypothetical protein
MLHGELFLSAAPYLFPEQQYSVASVRLDSGEVSGAVLRGNADLITAIACLPESDALLINAGSYRGDYPLEPLLLHCDLATNELGILHSQARGLMPRRLSDGTVLLLAGDGAEGAAAVDWTLPRSSKELQAVTLAAGMQKNSLQASPDGTWLAYLERGKTLQGQGGVAVFQRVKDGYALSSSGLSTSFAFAPGSDRACTGSDGGRRLSIILLPQD